MKTQAEIATKKLLDSRTCLNCRHSQTAKWRKRPVLKCSLAGKRVLPNMKACSYWERKHD